MSRKQKKTKLSYDPAIMDELLSQPGVKEKVDELTPDELRTFKLMLVRNGHYQRLVSARQKRLLRSMINPRPRVN
jgi:hypothetical protein